MNRADHAAAPDTRAAGIGIVRALGPTDEVRLLIGELDAYLARHYPPEQRLGVSLDALFQPHLRFYVARLAGAPAGCGGVAIFDGFAEIKRMYVRPALRGCGIADALMSSLQAEALAAGAARLLLQTGVHQVAAIRFYQRAGFAICEAFGAYLTMTPAALATSVFLGKPLAGSVLPASLPPAP